MARLAAYSVMLGLVLLGPVGCGPGPERRTAALLNDRLHAQLGRDAAANRVALRALPDGAQVTFLDASAIPGGPVPSDPGEGSPRAGLIEALLDPALMRVSITDTSPLPPDTREQRVAGLTRYFQAFMLGSILQPDNAPPAGPAGLAVTIRVACPRGGDAPGWRTGLRRPRCF